VPAGQHPGIEVPGIEVPGIASLAIRELLHGPRREGRVIAAVRGAIFAEFPAAAREPRVITISSPEVLRLPNAIIGAGRAGGGDLAGNSGLDDLPGSVAWTGGGSIIAGRLTVHVRRWWDPSPVFGPLSRARLDHGAAVLARLCAQADPGPGLAGHDGPGILAACCASGDLAGAVEQAEQLVGLGPGMVPGGDAVLCGVLLALRLLGGAIPGGTRAVWLAGWLSAAVTSYAAQRTTPLAAALLHCAARGQASAEVSAVLHGFAGEEPVEPAARKLLAAGRGAAGTGTADLVWGLVAGCRAAQVLSVS